jgi:hypothetical protein
MTIRQSAQQLALAALSAVDHLPNPDRIRIYEAAARVVADPALAQRCRIAAAYIRNSEECQLKLQEILRQTDPAPSSPAPSPLTTGH